jgi:hypothetical protein
MCNPSKKSTKDNQSSHVTRRLEKGKPIVDISNNVRLVHSNVGTISDNADRITASAKSGNKAFVH